MHFAIRNMVFQITSAYIKKKGRRDDVDNQELYDSAQVTNDDKLWGMLSHLGAFVGFFIPLGHILAPLIIYLVKKDSSPYVSNHAKESLNFQISITIYGIVAAILAFIIIGIVLALALVIFEIIYIIIAGMRANKGEMYKYPLTLRFIK